MICFHCKKAIRNRDPHGYVTYRIREDGPVHYRRWCKNCNTDEITDAEYPKDYREDREHMTHLGEFQIV